MIKTKKQLQEESIQKLNHQLALVSGDIESLLQAINGLLIGPDANITADVFNILTGMQRDLRYGKDNVMRIANVLGSRGGH